MEYTVLLYLTPTKVELPIKVKGEEAERIQSGFNVEYHVYRSRTGEKVREDTIKNILEVEVRGTTRVNPSTLTKGLILVALVEKGVIKKKDNLLIVE